MDAQRHLWEYAWFRDLVAIAAGLAVVWLVYAARAVTTPALIGLGLAYAVSPVVAWDARRRGVGRWQSTAGIMLAGLLAVVGLGLYVLPKLVGQLTDLLGNVPGYLGRVAAGLGIDLTQVSQQASQVLHEPGAAAQSAESAGRLTSHVDLQAVAGFLARGFGAGIGLVGSAVGLVTYLGVALVVVAFCFFGFSCAFQTITGAAGSLIPPRHRERTFRVVGRMDRAVSAFVRGRLIQSLVMGLILCAGWWLASVPYWLVLALVAAFLNLIPFAASVAWLVAVLLTWIDGVTGGAGFSVWHVLVWPSVVYFVAQGVDGWVVEPVVQGRATDLDPLTVLLAVLVGGSVAGVLGLVLAIPVTACVKILIEELLLPRLRPAGAAAEGRVNADRGGDD